MSNEKNKNSGDRRGFMEYLAIKTELPSDLLSGELRIEIRGRNTLLLHGCRRILKYSPEEMIMAVKGDRVSVRGRRLVCTTYHGGTVTLDGVVESVIFLCDKEDE